MLIRASSPTPISFLARGLFLGILLVFISVLVSARIAGRGGSVDVSSVRDSVKECLRKQMVRKITEAGQITDLAACSRVASGVVPTVVVLVSRFGVGIQVRSASLTV